MTLPSSGPLSLADIQTEFGGSNPASLNEYYAGGSYVPAGTSGTYGAVPSSGTISIQNFYGTSGVPAYWIIQSIVSGGGGSTVATGAAVDSSGGVYLVGLPDDNGSFVYQTGFYIIKTAQLAGSINSTTVVTNGYYLGYGARVAIDSSNNVYVAYNGPVTVSSVATYGIGLAKYNSSGVLQWSRTVGSSLYATPYDAVGGVVLDSSGNVYVSGIIDDGSGYATIVAKYDSSGTLQWGKNLTIPTSGFSMYVPSGASSGYNNRLSIDSANNIWVGCVAYQSSTSVSKPLAIVLDSSGTQVSRTLLAYGNTSTQNFGGVAFDSSGYVWFLAGVNSTYSSSRASLVLQKYTNATPPVLQSSARREILATTANTNWVATGVAVDSSNNVYIVGTLINISNLTLPIGNVIVKCNSSGVIQWQRQITKSGADIGLTNIIIDSSTTFIVSGYTSDGYSVSARFLLDGSRTGTYGSYTYSASSYSTGSYSTVGVVAYSGAVANFPGTTQSVSTTVTTASSPTLTTTIVPA